MRREIYSLLQINLRPGHSFTVSYYRTCPCVPPNHQCAQVTLLQVHRGAVTALPKTINGFPLPTCQDIPNLVESGVVDSRPPPHGSAHEQGSGPLGLLLMEWDTAEQQRSREGSKGRGTKTERGSQSQN